MRIEEIERKGGHEKETRIETGGRDKNMSFYQRGWKDVIQIKGNEIDMDPD